MCGLVGVRLNTFGGSVLPLIEVLFGSNNFISDEGYMWFRKKNNSIKIKVIIILIIVKKKKKWRVCNFKIDGNHNN